MTMIIDGTLGLEFPDNSDQTTAFTGNAATITSGTIATARLATGTANSSTYLRGDQTWAAIASSQWITSGANISYTTGNVGIGTATANIYSTGNVTNALGVQASGTNQNGLIAVAATGTGYGGVEFGNSTIRRSGIYTLDGSALTFYTNGTNSGTGLTERMRIDSSGNALIGTTTSGGGLTLAKSSTVFRTGSNAYPYPSGNSYFLADATPTSSQVNWIGMTGDYGVSTGSANLLLQANFNNTSQQAGNYIASEATGVGSAVLTFGRMIGGSSTGVAATKSEAMRIAADGTVTIGGNNILGVGIGQSWTNVGGSRSSGTTYTNSTGRPIQLMVATDNTGNTTYGSGGSAKFFINGNNVGESFCSNAANIGGLFQAIIPNGATYQVSASTIRSWWELR